MTSADPENVMHRNRCKIRQRQIIENRAREPVGPFQGFRPGLGLALAKAGAGTTVLSSVHKQLPATEAVAQLHDG